MSDEQSEPHTTAEGPNSLLTARLLSRGTDSLGLIDVRGAERHYARIMDWLAGRTPLVERLRERYGLTEGQAMNGLAFAEPKSWGGAQDSEPINLSNTQGSVHPATSAGKLDAAPGSLNAPPAEQIFTLSAHVPDDTDGTAPTESKRISRRGVPTFSPATPEPGGIINHEPREVVCREQVEGFKPLVEPTQERAFDLQPAPPLRESPATRVAEVAQTPTPRPATNPARESTPFSTRQTMPSVEERVTPSTVEQDIPLASGKNETPDVAVVSKQTVVSKRPGTVKSGVPRVNESSSADAATRLPTSRTPFSTSERRDATGAFVVDGAHGSAEGAARRSASSVGLKLPVAGETLAASVSFESPRPLAQAREIRAHAAETHELARDIRALPLAQSPAAFERDEPVRRQKDASTAVSRESSSGVTETYTTSRTAVPPRVEEMNVRRLTEQVSRHLTRRLLVERERRGLGRK